MRIWPGAHFVAAGHTYVISLYSIINISDRYIKLEAKLTIVSLSSEAKTQRRGEFWA